MNKIYLLKRDFDIIEISYQHHRVYLNEKKEVICMNLERFNSYVKTHNYLIIERTKF